ncbi:MAG: hypothetical protein QM704_20825 [Anaeromyxobacteraceae bacterium]
MGAEPGTLSAIWALEILEVHAGPGAERAGEGGRPRGAGGELERVEVEVELRPELRAETLPGDLRARLLGEPGRHARVVGGLQRVEHDAGAQVPGDLRVLGGALQDELDLVHRAEPQEPQPPVAELPLGDGLVVVVARRGVEGEVRVLRDEEREERVDVGAVEREGAGPAAAERALERDARVVERDLRLPAEQVLGRVAQLHLDDAADPAAVVGGEVARDELDRLEEAGRERAAQAAEVVEDRHLLPAHVDARVLRGRAAQHELTAAERGARDAGQVEHRLQRVALRAGDLLDLVGRDDLPGDLPAHRRGADDRLEAGADRLQVEGLVPLLAGLRLDLRVEPLVRGGERHDRERGRGHLEREPPGRVGGGPGEGLLAGARGDRDVREGPPRPALEQAAAEADRLRGRRGRGSGARGGRRGGDAELEGDGDRDGLAGGEPAGLEGEPPGGRDGGRVERLPGALLDAHVLHAAVGADVDAERDGDLGGRERGAGRDLGGDERLQRRGRREDGLGGRGGGLRRGLCYRLRRGLAGDDREREEDGQEGHERGSSCRGGTSWSRGSRPRRPSRRARPAGSGCRAPR